MANRSSDHESDQIRGLYNPFLSYELAVKAEYHCKLPTSPEYFFPEAFIRGYPRGSTFGVAIGSRSAKGREEFRKYHASAISVPGLNKIHTGFPSMPLQELGRRQLVKLRNRFQFNLLRETPDMTRRDLVFDPSRFIARDDIFTTTTFGFAFDRVYV